jgi:TPR repeat protein
MAYEQAALGRRETMRAVALGVFIAFSISVSAVQAEQSPDEKPPIELLAACDQAAAHPFDNMRPAGVPGVPLEKIIPETAISACELAAKAAPNDARIAMQLGRAYYAAKNFDAARTQYVKAYENGSAPAAANLALLYMHGQGGLPKDDVEAVRLSKIAADKGHAQGQNGLGNLFLGGRGGLPKDDFEAVRLFKLSADQGYPPAQNNLARLYQAGRGGLPKDDQEAARLYRMSADQGDAFGQANLGFFYMGGRGGLAKDEREAVRLFKLSADQGNAVGQVALGLAYERGDGGLPKDEREAVRLYKLSADQGNASAQTALARFDRIEKTGPLDRDMRDWLRDRVKGAGK